MLQLLHVCEVTNVLFDFPLQYQVVSVTWPESHRSEFETDRFFWSELDNNGGMRDHQAPISIFNEDKYH